MAAPSSIEGPPTTVGNGDAGSTQPPTADCQNAESPASCGVWRFSATSKHRKVGTCACEC
eukprot:5231484-Alexandrium_andersonii.AAC.1